MNFSTASLAYYNTRWAKGCLISGSLFWLAIRNSFNNVVEKQVCPASVLISFAHLILEGALLPSSHLPFHAAHLPLLALHPHLLFTVQQRHRWLLESHACPICTWNTGWKGAALWNRSVTIGTKTGILSVFISKMTSSNILCGGWEFVSSHTEANTKACVFSLVLLPLDSESPPLLESESPGVHLTASYGLVFAAKLGFFTPSKGCSTPSPALTAGRSYLITKRFQHLTTPPTRHTDPRSPSFGVNTPATSAASELVNKPSGETITLVAFRNKPWSSHWREPECASHFPQYTGLPGYSHFTGISTVLAQWNQALLVFTGGQLGPMLQ